MFSFQEQFSAATKSNLEAQIALMTAFTSKAFESIEKVIDLNMNVAKASLEESATNVQQLLSAKDPQEFFALTAAQAQPTAEKAMSYGRHLAGIASSTQAEFTKAAEAQIAETNRKVVALVEEISKNAPAGTENAVALVKSAIGSANSGYEQLSKTTKQAVEAFETNINAAATQFTQASAKNTSRASTRK
ncbi:MAG: Phasin (PHA-granule associated protein) [Burkholderiales bacterium RIFCSPLOWO2_02_FULL_57_36]|nr:MAG: Phasin (PHA-granule associated protein) [Burkholderiales bacterium RIFCSPLOWO2_02_FULL_57_36]